MLFNVICRISILFPGRPFVCCCAPPICPFRKVCRTRSQDQGPSLPPCCPRLNSHFRRAYEIPIYSLKSAFYLWDLDSLSLFLSLFSSCRFLPCIGLMQVSFVHDLSLVYFYVELHSSNLAHFLYWI